MYRSSHPSQYKCSPFPLNFSEQIDALPDKGVEAAGPLHMEGWLGYMVEVLQLLELVESSENLLKPDAKPWKHNMKINKQEGQKCPKRQVAQAAIRLATAVIKSRNKERNFRSPS